MFTANLLAGDEIVESIDHQNEIGKSISEDCDPARYALVIKEEDE